MNKRQLIVRQLKECYEENGESISIKVYEASKRSPSVKAIREEFGSWNKAVEASGIAPNNHIHEEHGIDEILEAIRKFYKEYDNPSAKLYKSLKLKPSLTTIERRLGWSTAVKMAGFTPGNLKSEVPKKKPRYSIEELVEAVRIFHEEYENPSSNLYRKLKLKPSLTQIKERVGWSNARRMAGIED